MSAVVSSSRSKHDRTPPRAASQDRQQRQKSARPSAGSRSTAVGGLVDVDWKDHHGVEPENDLIAAWVLAADSPPSAQFDAFGAE